MGEVWERSEPGDGDPSGVATLRGFEKVLSSWRAIFANTPYIQFFLTEEDVTVDGDVAWISLYENILQEVPGSGEGGESPELGDSRVAATNVFCRTAGRWRMVVHHGSPVARGFQPD